MPQPFRSCSVSMAVANLMHCAFQPWHMPTTTRSPLQHAAQFWHACASHFTSVQIFQLIYLCIPTLTCAPILHLLGLCMCCKSAFLPRTFFLQRIHAVAHLCPHPFAQGPICELTSYPGDAFICSKIIKLSNPKTCS